MEVLERAGLVHVVLEPSKNPALEVCSTPTPQASSNFETLVSLVQGWARDRNILNTTDATRQALKAASEFGEFADEVLKGNKEAAKMELGDVLVTLICTSTVLGIDMTDALAAAYNKISARKGTTVGGIFVKEGD